MIESQQIQQGIHIINQTDTADAAGDDSTDDHNGDEGVAADSTGGILTVTDKQVSDESGRGQSAQEQSDGVEQSSHNSAQQDETEIYTVSDAACSNHDSYEQNAERTEIYRKIDLSEIFYISEPFWKLCHSNDLLVLFSEHIIAWEGEKTQMYDVTCGVTNVIANGAKRTAVERYGRWTDITHC